MVSKPTGRTRGRPRKTDAAQSPKRRCGRPKKSLAQARDRWDYALIERHVEVGKMRGYSELEIQEHLAASRVGAIVLGPGEFRSCFKAASPIGSPIPWHKKFKRPQGDTPT